MGIIYKEVVRHKKISFIHGLLLVLLAILTANFFVNAWSYSNRYNIELEILLVAGFIFLIVVFKIAYDIAYRYRICYTYKLIDTELIFEKAVWKNKKPVLCINVKQIEQLLPSTMDNEIQNVARTYRFLCNSRRCKKYCCIVNQDGRKIMFYFQPSDELVKKLNVVMKRDANA